MNAVIAIEITIAVSIIACTSGSAILSPYWAVSRPAIGGEPAVPPACSMSRLAPLPMSKMPSIILVIDRSSSRYTPAAMNTPVASRRNKFASIASLLRFLSGRVGVRVLLNLGFFLVAARGARFGVGAARVGDRATGIRVGAP